jgi:hypothetical protein
MDRRTFLKIPAAGLLISDKGGLNPPIPPAAAPNPALARPDLSAGFTRRGLTLPPGIKIDFTSFGVRIRDIITGSGDEKPRLAALIDDMWHHKKLPLLDSNSDSELLLWSKEGDKDELICHPNQAAMTALGGFLVSEIKLHAVNGATAEYLGVAMRLKPNGGKSATAGTAARPAVILDGADSFRYFREVQAIRGDTLRNTVYFASLHFGGIADEYLRFGSPPLGDKYNNYDIDSPYCFPVKFKATFTGKDSPLIYQISKSGRLMVATDDEATDYRKYV